MKQVSQQRRLVAAAIGIFLGCSSWAVAEPAWKPDRPIRLVLGYTPGGAADQVARDLAPAMEKVLGQPVVVDYKPGAGGAIGAEAVANAPADGYTIGLVDGAPLTIIPHARTVKYDPIESFSYVGLVTRSPLVLLVHPSLQVQGVQELVSLLRKSPGAISYSTSGLGTIHHLSGELFKQSTGTSMVHIPYRGAAPAMNDLMAGEVKVSFATIGPAVPVVQSGRARAIGVTSAGAVPSLPGVKPIADQGVPGYDSQGMFVLVAPKGASAAIVQALNAALNTALENPAIRDRLVSFGSTVTPSTPQEAADISRKDFRRWGALISEQGIRFE